MTDIASIAIETSSILITVVKLLRRASKQQKERASTIQSYITDAEQTKSIIELVEDQDAVQTSSVIKVIQRVKTFGEQANEQLTHMDKPRGPAKGFVHQLTKGQDEERELADLFGKMNAAKADLSLQIQLANVGLTKTVESAIAINTTLVEQVNELLQEVLGHGKGLLIADFAERKHLENRNRMADGMVQITAAEYEELKREQARAAHPEATAGTTGSSILDLQYNILENVTRDQAVQLNGSIGEIIWKKTASIKIERNEATGNSFQGNGPIAGTDLDKILARWSPTTR